MEDTLSRVLLTPAVLDRWNKVCEGAVEGGVKPDDIAGEEMAREGEHGSLVIYVALTNGGEVSMTVEKHEWAWAGPRNN